MSEPLLISDVVSRFTGTPFDEGEDSVFRGTAYEWRNGNHYLSLEVYWDGRAEWFYKNLGSPTYDLWEIEHRVNEAISAVAIERLILVGAL